MMIEDSHVESRLVEYRAASAFVSGNSEGPLVAVCLTDFCRMGFPWSIPSSDPASERRSLGTFMILDHIERARRLGLPHVYLGYWVEGSSKMAYKGRFLPQERLVMNGWERAE